MRDNLKFVKQYVCICKQYVPENIHTYPMEGHNWKFQGGGGSFKAKIFNPFTPKSA